MHRNAEIEDAVTQLLQALRKGDADAATTGISEELTVMIGTDDEEWWEGYDASVEAVRAQLDASGGFPIETFEVRGYALGEVGWFEVKGTIAIEAQPPFGVRMTGVLRREAGGWGVLQMHASTGTPNAELGMDGLPV